MDTDTLELSAGSDELLTREDVERQTQDLFDDLDRMTMQSQPTPVVHSISNHTTPNSLSGESVSSMTHLSAQQAPIQPPPSFANAPQLLQAGSVMVYQPVYNGHQHQQAGSHTTLSQLTQNAISGPAPTHRIHVRMGTVSPGFLSPTIGWLRSTHMHKSTVHYNPATIKKDLIRIINRRVKAAYQKLPSLVDATYQHVPYTITNIRYGARPTKETPTKMIVATPDLEAVTPLVYVNRRGNTIYEFLATATLTFGNRPVTPPQLPESTSEAKVKSATPPQAASLKETATPKKTSSKRKASRKPKKSNADLEIQHLKKVIQRLEGDVKTKKQRKHKSKKERSVLNRNPHLKKAETA